jgi:hypothetical protein
MCVVYRDFCVSQVAHFVQGLLLQFDVLGAISVFSSTMFVLMGFVPVGLAALSIVSAMTFSTSVYWTCRGYTELELCLK